MDDERDATQEVLETWERVSSGWERNRDRVFQSFRVVSDWLIDMVDPQPGQTILELASGPGETGFVVAVRVGPSGRVLSTDLAPGMVEAARRGAEMRGLDNVECRIMDAQSMDLPDDSFDAILCRFGFMLMPDPRTALKEARRVMRAGGKLAFAVWAPPDRNPWIGLVGMTLMQLGHAAPTDPFGPGGIFSMASPDVPRDLTQSAGFLQVSVEELPFVQRFESFADYWKFTSEIAGPLALALQSLSGDGATRTYSALEEAAAPFRSGSGYEFPSLALGVSGS
jgi:ubiquinone/menaquinone biosynthesis C-methylase UbiE